MIDSIVLIVCALWLGWSITLLILRAALRFNIVQVPNLRSSHTVPRPHSGGVGIVLSMTICSVMALKGVPSPLPSVLVLAFILAAVGAFDDLWPLPAGVRLSIQFVASAFLIRVVGPLPIIVLPGGVAVGSWGMTALLLLTGVWWINLFNFMDGIDGIAATQALFMLCAGAVLGAYFHPEATQKLEWLCMWLLAAATAGFLFFNWPAARIFMGDVGSQYLAFMILALALRSISSGWLSYRCWLILGAVFITDTTLTLLRRTISGEPLLKAHRQHAYQALTLRWNSHRQVTVLSLIINLFWVTPLAWFSLVFPVWAWTFVLITYLPLVWVAWRLCAPKRSVS